jgi:hypothetical protein
LQFSLQAASPEAFGYTLLIRVIKSRMIIWVGQLSCMGDLKGRNHMGDPGIDGRIIL